ncbi:MAG: hypothetical protein G8D88_13830 [gamma proteobacterium symbiont of Ctena orbiculata]
MDADSILEQLLGTVVHTVGTDAAASGSLSLTTFLLSLIAAPLLIFCVVYICYRIWVYVMKAASDGEVDHHFKWFALGMAISMGSLIPLSNGLPSAQNAAIWAVKSGSDLANTINTIVQPKLVSTPAISVVSPGSTAVAANALRMLTCGVWANDYKGDKLFTLLEKTTKGIDIAKGHCGTVRWPIETTDNADYVTGVKKATTNLLADLLPVARKIVFEYNTYLDSASSKAPAGWYERVSISDAQMSEAVKAVRLAASKYANAIESVAQSEAAKNTGLTDKPDWVQAGSRWHDIQALHTKAATLSTEAHKAIIYKFSKQLLEADSYFNPRKYISATNQISSEVVATATSVGTGIQRIDFAPLDATCIDLECSYDNFQRHISHWLRAEIIHELANSKTDPVGSMIRLGTTFNNSADVLTAAQFTAATISALPVVGDNLTNMVEQVQETMGKYSEKLEEAGIKLTIWIPKTPTTAWAYAIEYWLTNIIIAIAVAAFLPVTFLFQSDGLLSPAAKISLSIIVSAVFIPSFLVIGNGISQGLVPLVIQVYNSLYWGDLVSESVQGIIQSIGDLEFYVANLYRVIFALMFFVYVGFMWGVWKIFGYAGDVSSGQSIQNVHNEARQGTQGLAGGSAPKMNFGGGGNKISGK